MDEIQQLPELQDAVLVAHYYVDDGLQEPALKTGGHVADSLEMARFGHDRPAQTLIVAGVRFMGETAKILNPGKRVQMVEDEATCSLDLFCPIDRFGQFCDAHPDRKVAVYATTSAEIKARSDWVVTSGIALDDVVGSTTALINAVQQSDAKRFIVATDRGIIYKMRSVAGDKELFEAPTEGKGASCVSCGHCPWMAINTLYRLRIILLSGGESIEINVKIAEKALSLYNACLIFLIGEKWT